jgi:predicted HAD superfamily Cof-like phosphohydrolase
MEKSQEMVKEFHEKFDSYVGIVPELPEDSELALRLHLIMEEQLELSVAMMDHNFVEVVKELGDLLYVAYGTAVACGADMEPIMQEIHRSNMSKLQPDGSVAYREDGKILKPDTYSPADLKPIIEKQLGETE